MNPAIAFLVDIAFLVALSVGIVAYVKSHLNSLLIDLCGTPERASFWLAFSKVTMVFVSLIFALDYNPEFGPDRNCLFERATQLKTCHRRRRHYASLSCVHPVSLYSTREPNIAARVIPMNRKTANCWPEHTKSQGPQRREAP